MKIFVFLTSDMRPRLITEQPDLPRLPAGCPAHICILGHFAGLVLVGPGATCSVTVPITARAGPGEASGISVARSPPPPAARGTPPARASALPLGLWGARETDKNVYHAILYNDGKLEAALVSMVREQLNTEVSRRRI